MHIRKNSNEVRRWRTSDFSEKQHGVWRWGDGAAPGKFCDFFPHLSLETVSPALKLTRNSNMNISSFFLKTGKLTINWFPHSCTHTVPHSFTHIVPHSYTRTVPHSHTHTVPDCPHNLIK